MADQMAEEFFETQKRYAEAELPTDADQLPDEEEDIPQRPENKLLLRQK